MHCPVCVLLMLYWSWPSALCILTALDAVIAALIIRERKILPGLISIANITVVVVISRVVFSNKKRGSV